MKVFEIELTMEEVEILRLALTNNMGTAFALTWWAKEKGKSVEGVMDLARRLYEKFDTIIQNNTL